MFSKLLLLEWRSFFRSASLGRGIAVKLFLAFIGLYFLLCSIGLGIGLYFVLDKGFPNEEPMVLVNNVLLFWFIGEFVMRFMLQNLPVADIKPLLVQRIDRNKIIHFLMFKSSYAFLNVLTLAVALPFVIVNFKESTYSMFQLLAWLVGVSGFVYFNNYLNIWVQRRFLNALKNLIPFILGLSVLIGLEYYGIFSISNLFGQFFNAVLAYPILGVLPIIIAIAMYRVVFIDLKTNIYLDTYLTKEENNALTSNLSWLDRFGVLAPFMQLDIKLIMRNKRAKNTVLLSLFFLFYGLLFYTNTSFGGSGYMLVFVGIFMTGIFIINFGQFIPAWDSSYFPLLRTQPIMMKNYLTSKVVLMYISVFILTLLSTCYAYFGWDKVYLNYACAVYNIGINIPVILAFSMYNRKRIDLAQGSMLNYQGMGITQWLISIPLLVFPIMIWGATQFLFSVNTANLVLIVIGLIGLLFHKVIINAVAEGYIQKKYLILEGFKQKA